MPNAIALREVLWVPDALATFDCQRSDLAVHLEIVRGLDETPLVRGEDDIVPGLAGRIAVGTWDADIRDIQLDGWVQGSILLDNEGDRMESYEATLKAIQAAFDPTVLGYLFVRDTTGVRSIRARPLPPIVYGREDVKGIKSVAIAMQSLAPYWGEGADWPGAVTWDDVGLAPAWQDAHTYIAADHVIGDSGDVWEVSIGGDSGAIEPDWTDPSPIIDNDVTWTKLPPWTPTTGYAVDNVYTAEVPNGHVYIVVVGGVSGASAPAFTTDGSTFQDPA